MINLEKALSVIKETIKEVSSETVSINEALGRALSKSVVAKFDSPNYKTSAMDGYAIKHQDTISLDKPFKVIAEITAGHPSNYTISHYETARIFTGGVMPKGSDTVIIQENAKKIAPSKVIFKKSVRKNAYVRNVAQDFKKNSLLINKNKILSARDVGVLASANQTWVSVRRKPNIGILSSGDEVIRPGESIKKGYVYSSSSVLVSSLIKLLGGQPIELEIAKDTKKDIKKAILNNKKLDALVTIGGISVGKKDLIRSVLVNEGLKTYFWKVAIRPGKPVMYGMLDDIPVLSLPGNPVSAYLCSIIFLRPIIYKMIGQKNISMQQHDAQLTESLDENDIRETFVRAKSKVFSNGILKVTPLKDQDSSLVNSLANSNCLIRIKPFMKFLKKGSKVKILYYPNSNLSL